MSEKLLEVKNLKKYFNVAAGELHAVDGVSLTLEKGRTLGIVGESGCGKSTLGRTLLMLNKPTSGSVVFDGKELTTMGKHEFKAVQPKMQMIFQDPFSSLNGRMTVRQLIAEPLIVNRVCKSKQEMWERVDKMMETVGLAQRLADAYPHELDGGRRQRIGVARALILEPKLVVCDEPVSALDVSIQAQILNLLMDLQEQMNLSYLFITHDLSVVKHISDEIMVMYMGCCVEKASYDEIFARPLHPYTQGLLAAIPVPSATSRGKLHELMRGEVMSPVNPAPGCRFAARCPGWEVLDKRDEDNRKRSVEAIQIISEKAEEFGVTLYMEEMATIHSCFTDSMIKLYDLFKSIGRENVKPCYDSYMASLNHESFEEYQKLFGDIDYIHFSDSNEEGYTALGAGNEPLESFLKKRADEKYEGTFSISLWGGGYYKDPDVQLRKTTDFLRYSDSVV